MNILRTFGRTALLPLALIAAAATAQAQQVIRIGAPLALTGGLADEAREQQVAYDMWLKRVKAVGGIDVGGKKLKVELVESDYQSNDQRAQQMAEKMISQDKVDFIVSPFGSGHTKVVAGVAERYGVPVVAPSASSESVFDQGFKYLFGTLAPNGGLVETMVQQFVKKRPGVKRIAILGREDVFPRPMLASMREAARKAGLEIVHDELYPVGNLDFSASMSRIRATKPDWIYVTGYDKDLILARKQMADLGVAAPIVTMITGPAYPEFVNNLGPLAENVSSVTWWHKATPYTSGDVFGSTKAFHDEYLARAKAEPDYVGASSAAARWLCRRPSRKPARWTRPRCATRWPRWTSRPSTA
ncbi:amino acid ABC transporter substrate-binding protein [Xylophilus sp. ASV27]|uniref:amino acid ABC transporter substrate-binding protein n=1 Tax=Xylophilus sp. ASV27 TaxID=2795129 RepID=UPI0018ECE8B0|nr:amino acid ABC transporter substrate-binding protein [Xylophilus sp. ASV27]